jgi:hypothetical protein
VLKDFGFQEDAFWLSRLDVDDTFTAVGIENQETITRFVSQELHIPAAQLELNAYLRVVRRHPDASERNPFHGDLAGIERTVAMLVTLVRELVRFRRR